MSGRRGQISICVDGPHFSSSASDHDYDGDRENELEALIAQGSFVAARDLEMMHVLGRGSCSYVQEARHRSTRVLYAVKVFNVYDKERSKQLVRELRTLYDVNCPSIVQFHGVYKADDERVHIVLEHMDRGSLHDILHCSKCSGGVPEPVAAAISFQILWGLGYLHFEHKLHRDIKPSNILVNREGSVRLTDFGIARGLGEDELASTMVGTFRYMSPERLIGEEYGSAADVWSLGLVLLELATGQVPFIHCTNQIDFCQLLEEIEIDDYMLRMCRGLSPAFREVIQNCLKLNPSQRLPAAVLLSSPFFKQTGITSLEVAVSYLQDWLGEHPPLEREYSDSYYCDSAQPRSADQTEVQMVTTWKSTEDGDSSCGEDFKESSVCACSHGSSDVFERRGRMGDGIDESIEDESKAGTPSRWRMGYKGGRQGYK
jgi:serine/threonine protein kinase